MSKAAPPRVEGILVVHDLADYDFNGRALIVETLLSAGMGIRQRTAGVYVSWHRPAGDASPREPGGSSPGGLGASPRPARGA